MLIQGLADHSDHCVLGELHQGNMYPEGSSGQNKGHAHTRRCD